ncbi:MAG: hypothetical protein IH951_08975, partial [Bacteroidetes bacterium]|nr:hypothetical protein [Bacteroidota bacterium]
MQGNLTVQGNRLLLAGGNQVSPAAYDLDSGVCSAAALTQGQPKSNNGRFVGTFRGEHAIVGGRILFSAPQNVSTKGSFQVVTGGRRSTLSFGGIPPAWNEKHFALVNYQRGQLTCCDADKVAARIKKGPAPRPG